MSDIEQNEPAATEPGRSPFASAVQAALIGALAGAFVTWISTPWLDLFKSQPFHIQLWVSLGAGVLVGAVTLIPMLRDLIQRHPKQVRTALCVLAGGALTTGVWTVVQAVAADDQCPAPAELRLVTAPENVTELTARAQSYVRQHQTEDGCPVVRMTVGVAPPPIHLRDAFDNRWEWREDRRDQPYARLYDLQPDAWVATSAAEPDELRAGGLQSLGAPGPENAVGRDRLVLAMTPQRREELSTYMDNPDGYAFREVWDTLTKKMGMTVARPFPETSVAALIGTHDVFHDRGLPRSRYPRAEQELVENGLGADTVTSLLCEFDRLADKADTGDPKIALLVPGHSVDDFNANRVEGCEGTGDSAPLVAVRHHDLSTLDYRFVKVTWPDQRSAGREKLVDHFGAWLRAHPLFPSAPGPGESGLGPQELGQLKRLVLDELRPRLDLRLLIDTSGSADRPVRVQAAEAVRANSRLLGPRDEVQVFGLHAFTRNGPAVVTRIVADGDREQLGTVAASIENTAFDKWDAPASAGLGRLGTGDEAVATPVVLLTDGRLFDNEGRGDAAKVIARALEDASTVSGLYVVVFGQDECAVTALQDTRKPYRCVTASEGADKALTRAIITVRGWR
ncbi:substrate-binding domain-containing protein [Nonomuraea diastatica]|uniref:VWA domain-containing protein n=1 Tax=Nonomuraea diastatica TaxID=1848329 RepID=A0A4V2YDE1_9ACTN|nr:substrate-binding domain-containing protein [Nonomuraea diastatica]TDD15036.1 hypothetical protein E1294_35565 [Nonomuraea diastatica]